MVLSAALPIFHQNHISNSSNFEPDMPGEGQYPHSYPKIILISVGVVSYLSKIRFPKSYLSFACFPSVVQTSKVKGTTVIGILRMVTGKVDKKELQIRNSRYGFSLLFSSFCFGCCRTVISYLSLV
ncbi:unnamed protein product [Malus baccata var. baccata]